MSAAGGNYPSLASLVPTSAVPTELGFLDGAVDLVLGGLRYSDLAIDTSPEGDGKAYAVTLATRELALDLFGSGVRLILFPADQSGPVTSEIPVAFAYRWPIRRYWRNFDLLSFDGGARAFFDLVLTLIDVTEEEFVEGVVAALVSDPAPYQSLYAKISSWQNGASPLGLPSLADVPPNQSPAEYLVTLAQGADVGHLCGDVRGGRR